MEDINSSPLHAKHDLEMMAPANPSSLPDDKLKIQLPDHPKKRFLCCGDNNNNNNNNVIDHLKQQKMKKKISSSPGPQNKSVSLAPSQAANPRITLTLDKAIEYELKHGRKLDPNMDRKKLRRTISNRLSAQRSRIKKAQYINDMEKMVIDLQELISVLSPQIESYKEKRKLLMVQNDSLQKLVEIRSNESKQREMELELKRVQVHSLKQLEKSNVHDSDPKIVQDLISSKQLASSAQLYPCLGFYQNGLQHLHKFGSNQQPPPIFAQMAPCFAKDQQQPAGFLEKNQFEEAADIDQYLNFEALNVDLLIV